MAPPIVRRPAGGLHARHRHSCSGREQAAIDHLAASKHCDRGEVTSYYLRGLSNLRLKSAPEALAAFQIIIDHPQIGQFSIVHPLARLGKARTATIAGDSATIRTA